MRPTLTQLLLLALALPLCAAAGASAPRTFVSTGGSDSNTGANCAPTAPCRSFAAALSVTASGGEVVVLDSGGYGPPGTITQSVTITAPEGVYAGISVPAMSTAGVIVDGVSILVTLRGLTFESQGGADAIRINNSSGLNNNVSALVVERCFIHGFPESGIYVNSLQSGVSVYDSTIDATGTSSNGIDGITLVSGGGGVGVYRSVITGASRAGIYAAVIQAPVEVTDSLLSGNATAIATTDAGKVTVSGSRIHGPSVTAGSGINLGGTIATTAVNISGTVISDYAAGVLVAPNATIKLAIKGSTFSSNGYGINTGSGSSFAAIDLDVSDSVIADSTIANVALGASGSTLATSAVFARSSLTGSPIGASLGGGSGSALAFSGCLIANNGTGLQTAITFGASQGFLSLGNNIFVGNGTDVSGTLTRSMPR